MPATDQRGALRGPAGLNAGSSPDIGAYEASSSYQVNTTTDSTDMGTLRAAIAWANLSTNANPANLAPNATAPDTVVFNTSGAFSTTQTITISPTLGPIMLSNTSSTGESINGTASNGLILSGGGATQVLSIAPGATAILSGLTISGGSSTTSGGAITNAGNLTVTNSTLMGNSAASGGGAIDNLGMLNIQDSTLNNNSAGAFGGAVDNETKGSFTTTNSTFAFNTAPQGGAIYSTGTLTAINATIAYNTSTTAASGGGLNVAHGLTSLYNSIIASNTDTSGQNPADDIVGTVTNGFYNVIGTGGSGGLVNGVDGNQVGVSNPGLGSGLTANGGPTDTITLQAGSPAINAGVAVPVGLKVPAVTLDQRGALRDDDHRRRCLRAQRLLSGHERPGFHDPRHAPFGHQLGQRQRHFGAHHSAGHHVLAVDIQRLHAADDHPGPRHAGPDQCHQADRHRRSGGFGRDDQR